MQNQLADWGQGEMKGDKPHSQLPALVAGAVPFSGVGWGYWGKPALLSAESEVSARSLGDVSS